MTSKHPCDTPREDDQARRRDVYTAVFVTGTCLAAFLLRAWALRARGVVSYDETYYYILGRNLFTGRGYTLNGLPHTAFPPLYPILVGFASLFVTGIREATSSVSALAGALLPIPVYFLAKDVHGRRAGLLAAAAVAVWPALFFFAARSVTYSQRLYAGSEPLFLVLVMTAIVCLWRARKGAAFGCAAAAGAAFGLAALTRNEGLAVFAFALAWFLVHGLVIPRGKRIVSIAKPVVATASAVAVLMPYVVYIHSVTGAWDLGSKAANLARVRPTLYEWIAEGDATAYTKVHYALNDSATSFVDDYWGVPSGRQGSEVGGPVTGLSTLLKPDLRWLGFFARAFTDGYLRLMPLYAWPFVAIGIALAAARAGPGRAFVGLFAMLVAAFVFTAVITYAIARFELPVAAVLIIFFAGGLDAVAAFAVSRIPPAGHPFARQLAYGSPVVVILALLSATGIRANLLGGRAVNVPGAFSSSDWDTETAAKLAARLRPGQSLMCNKPWIAVWAGLDWRASPAASPAQILDYARANSIDYALFGPWQIDGPIEKTVLGPGVIDEFTGADTLYLADFTAAAYAQ